MVICFSWNVLASTDQTIPSPAAAMTTTSHITFERERCLPLSKMYCMPCSELVAEYSTIVLANTSWLRSDLLTTLHFCSKLLKLPFCQQNATVFVYGPLSWQNLVTLVDNIVHPTSMDLFFLAISSLEGKSLIRPMTAAIFSSIFCQIICIKQLQTKYICSFRI